MSDLAQLTALAKRQRELEGRIAKGEALLKDLNDQLRLVAERDIPDAMDSLEMAEFTLTDGACIRIKEDIACGISKATQAVAFTWLRKHGHGALIKRDITIKFGKGEEKLASKLLSLLKKQFPQRPVNDKENVHYQTLKAFLKEQLAAGTSIPMETFGVMPIRRAIIELSATES